MSRQLDILALEPFYGGARRALLAAVMRCSRHRWTLLKLPPRRIERRLSAAANWFAEQLRQHFDGHVDVLFTSEAMNLATLLRLVPDLASRPSVVYFHDNHLPDLVARQDGPYDLIDLNTALAATEIWFNSDYHYRVFLERVVALAARHPELAAHDPIPKLVRKSHRTPPPMDLGFADEVRAATARVTNADGFTIFVETRDADMNLLNAGLDLLSDDGPKFRLMTVGPVERLSHRWPHHAIRETDLFAQMQGMLESNLILSAKPAAKQDGLLVQGILAGCTPLAPNAGVYPELLPAASHPACLYTPAPQSLADALRGQPSPPTLDWRRAFKDLEAIPACRLIDERLDQLARQ